MSASPAMDPRIGLGRERASEAVGSMQEASLQTEETSPTSSHGLQPRHPALSTSPWCRMKIRRQCGHHDAMMAKTFSAILAAAVLSLASYATGCVKINIPVSTDGQFGKVLTNHSRAEIECPNHVICGKVCLARGWCSSFNYLPSRQLCQLNDVTGTDYPDDVTTSTSPTDLYCPVGNWPQELLMGCAHHNCSLHERCTPSPQGPLCMADPLLTSGAVVTAPMTSDPPQDVTSTIAAPCTISTSCTDCSPERAYAGYNFRPVECYWSPPGHALPHSVASFRGSIDWNTWPNLSYVINPCAELAGRHGYELFGIEFFGECYGGNASELDRSRGAVPASDCATRCTADVGASSIMFVFELF